MKIQLQKTYFCSLANTTNAYKTKKNIYLDQHVMTFDKDKKIQLVLQTSLVGDIQFGIFVTYIVDDAHLN